MQAPDGMSMVGSVIGVTVLVAWRIRESRSTVSIKNIIMPPLGMATGFSMFLLPSFRISWIFAVASFVIGGSILAYPMMLTSRLAQVGNEIKIKRSNYFIFMMIALAVIRIITRHYFCTILSPEQTIALFFTLAFGMILRWRVHMLLEYRAITTKIPVLKADS
ncbi:MAG: cytochrome c biogenesis protein CcdC [Bradyrhizobium sp.]|nr:cytochrome c biogenesis protein CcdC [Bradyrhizobium sp.]